MCSRTTSAIDRALCRMDAVSDVMSCTPPMKTLPMRIQSKAGSQPKNTPARIGPTIGPAAGKLMLQPDRAHYMSHRPEEPTHFCLRSQCGGRANCRPSDQATPSGAKGRHGLSRLAGLVRIFKKIVLQTGKDLLTLF